MHVEHIHDTIKTSGHSSLEKYTSHFIERVVCERWVGDWTELQHIDPHQLFWRSQPFFPSLLGCSTGGLGPSLCWDMVLIPASSLQPIWTSCRRGYIIIWHSPTSCERHNSHSIQPLDSQGRPLISSTGCTCYLHRCISSFDSLTGVNIQHGILRSMAYLFVAIIPRSNPTCNDPNYG